MSTLGLYRPADSLLHTMRPGYKLLGLLSISVVQVVFSTMAVSLGLLAVAVIVLLISRVGLLDTLRSLRMLILSLLALAAYHVWVDSPESAVTLVAGLLAVVVLASVVTATTRMDELLDTLIAVLAPARRFGISPDRIALTVSLVLRAVPTTLDLSRETSDAAKARGLDRSLRARLVPFVLRVVARAQLTGEALMARGIGDD
jgi:biotin transport system permease protein